MGKQSATGVIYEPPGYTNARTADGSSGQYTDYHMERDLPFSAHMPPKPLSWRREWTVRALPTIMSELVGRACPDALCCSSFCDRPQAHPKTWIYRIISCNNLYYS
jgi:hypothetical protein